jgi:ABC-2 type transport system ATP-binding protein
METTKWGTRDNPLVGDCSSAGVLSDAGPSGVGGGVYNTASLSGPLLAIHNLEKRYALFALRVENLEVCDGEIVGLLGANGAGKTTLIRSLMGIVGADRADITCQGRKVMSGDPYVKTAIGYVPEDPILYENERVGGLLAFVGALYPDWDSELCNTLLLRFGIEPKKKVSMLSKGMRTKLLLVIALAHKPKILILDEPTSGLDPLSRDDFWAFLRELFSTGQTRAALISSHQLEDVEQICNRAIFISNGSIVYDRRDFSAVALRHLFESHRPAGRVPSF